MSRKPGKIFATGHLARACVPGTMLVSERQMIWRFAVCSRFSFVHGLRLGHAHITANDLFVQKDFIQNDFAGYPIWIYIT